MIDAHDLIAPHGKLTLAMFPLKEDGKTANDLDGLEHLAEEFVHQAEEHLEGTTLTDEAVIDRATLAYAYHLAFSAVADRLATEAMSVSLNDQGSRSRTQGQLDYFARRAGEFLEAYVELVPPVVATEDPPRTSGYAANRFVW